LPGTFTCWELPIVLAVVVVAVAVLVALVLVRTVFMALRPSEIDRFHTASSLTSAWSRGEEWPPPAEPEDQRSSTLEHGRSRSSRT
jgi:hypothetical protein